MNIDREADGPSREWCVPVSISVLEHVPRDVLAAWMAIESYADRKGRCYPDNRMLARRMGVKAVSSVQRAVLKLEEYGIVRRHDQGNNRRLLVLLRRTSAPITGAEWAVLSERGEARGQARTGHLFDAVPGLET